MNLRYMGIFSLIGGIPLVLFYFKKNISINNTGMIYLFEKIIYFKSIYDIQLNKLKRTTFLFLNHYNIDFGKIKNDMEFIKNGKSVLFSNKESFQVLDLSKEDIKSIDYDFILYSKFDMNTETIYKKIILKDLTKITEDDFHIEESSVRFLLTEIVIDDKRVKIDFKQNNNTFYLVNNKINKAVILYFLNEFYPDELDEKDKNNLNLSILDDTANEIECNNRVIAFLKDSYQLEEEN